MSFPITLDKTEYTTTYKWVENNSVSIDIFAYSGNYIWISIIYDAGCTIGLVKARIAKSFYNLIYFSPASSSFSLSLR